LNEEVVTNVPALPDTSGILTLNVCVSPFVNVKLRVPLSNDAVINAKLAELNKLAVAEFKLDIDEFAEAVNVLYPVLISNWDAVNAFNDVNGIEDVI
jgi:hypothetical protein